MYYRSVKWLRRVACLAIKICGTEMGSDNGCVGKGIDAYVYVLMCMGGRGVAICVCEQSKTFSKADLQFLS